MSTQPTALADSPMPNMPLGGNIEDRMTERLSSALSTESEPSQAETIEIASPDIDNAPEIASEEPEISEEAADATASEPEVAEPDPYADENDADPNVIESFLKTPRGREIYAGHKFVRELAKPYSQGGIGHAPSVQEIRQHFDSHRAAVQMYADFNSGDSQRMGQFLAHWFGPNPQTGRMDQPKLTALQNLEPTLARFGADAYGSVAAPIMARYESALIDKWRSATSPELKQALYQAAQVIHHDTHDEWLPETAFTSTGAVKPPNQAEREQIAGEWQKLNAARQQAQQETEGRWNAKLQEAETSTLSAEIDKALKPLQSMREKTPEVYESLKERFANQVKQSMTSDPEVWNLYQARVEQARRTGNPAVVEQVSKNFLSLLVPVIKAKRAPFLQGAGVVIRQQSDDKHAQLRRIASNATPSNTGVPVRRSVVPNTARKPGETNEVYRERRMLEAMGA